MPTTILMHCHLVLTDEESARVEHAYAREQVSGALETVRAICAEVLTSSPRVELIDAEEI
jgi:hypothetical protein